MTNLVLAPPSRTLDTLRPAKLGLLLGVGGLVSSALLMTILNVVASGQMSVLNTTMSDYVFVDGVGWMFGASLISMCVAGVGTAIGLTGVRLFSHPVLRLSLGLAMLSLVLAAAFRTDLGESLSTSAQIHRYAAGVVFFCVPIAAILVARQLADIGFLARYRKLLYANVLVTCVVLTAFLTSHLGAMPEAIQELNGLFQRMLFAAELAVLAQLTLLPQRFQLPASRTQCSPPPDTGRQEAMPRRAPSGRSTPRRAPSRHLTLTAATVITGRSRLGTALAGRGLSGGGGRSRRRARF